MTDRPFGAYLASDFQKVLKGDFLPKAFLSNVLQLETNDQNSKKDARCINLYTDLSGSLKNFEKS